MTGNYDSREVQDIVRSLTTMPGYQGYWFDERMGFRKGPCDVKGEIPNMPAKLADGEALIGLREPISRLPQRPIILLEREGDGWKFKKHVATIEGTHSRG
ncbi:MAG: hypothetical protein ABIH37_03005 [archaeon]